MCERVGVRGQGGASVKVTSVQRLEWRDTILGRGSSCVRTVGGTFEGQQGGMWLACQGGTVNGRSRDRRGLVSKEERSGGFT